MQNNPSMFPKMASDVKNSIMGEYATIDDINDAYNNDNAGAMWIVAAIENINEFCSSKSMSNEQIQDIAYMIANEYKNMKHSQLQLFFYRFKCGYFGKFYGKIDPMVITCALKDFADECQAKRQEYLHEEYEAKKQAEDDFRQDVYRKWYDFFNEFMENVAAVDKKILNDIYIEKIFYEDKSILLFVTKDQYDLLEGVYCKAYFQVFKKYFPDLTIHYRLKKILSPAEQHQSEESKKTLMNVNEEKIAISSAQSVIDNTYQLDKSGIALLRETFRKRYGLFPEDFLVKNEKGTKGNNINHSPPCNQISNHFSLQF